MEYQTQNILGHDKNIFKLTKIIKKKKLPNSIIFKGKKGIGKTTAAYRIAQFIFEQKENPSDEYKFIHSEIYRKICNGSFPNLLVIQKQWLDDKKRFKNQIFRDDIDSVKRFYSNKESSNEYRICIIDNIDDFSIDASNSLLKLIEEPPKNSLFLIINHNTSRLLKTIESRSFTLNFNKLNIVDYTSLLNINNYIYKDYQKLYQLNDANLQSSFNYINSSFDTIDNHFTSLLLNRKNVKINTASYYLDFVNNNDSKIINDNFINYMLLRIKKTLFECISSKNNTNIYRLIKSYYLLDNMLKNQKTYNLNFDHILKKFFLHLRNE